MARWLFPHIQSPKQFSKNREVGTFRNIFTNNFNPMYTWDRKLLSTCATLSTPGYDEKLNELDPDSDLDVKIENNHDANEKVKHCQTCTCDHHDDPPIHDLTSISRHRAQHVCQDDYREHDLPLPPPLPEPKFSFHRRIMPKSLVQFSSPEGRRIFQQSLAKGMAEAFFPLSEQFLNQSDPAYCGITTLIMVLNAIGIDPNIRWKGGWRWYGSEDMILNSCCIHPERVRRAGILLEEFRSLGRCQGLQVEMKRPIPPMGANMEDSMETYCSLDDFRRDIVQTVQHPPIFEQVQPPEHGNKRLSAVDGGPGKYGGFMVVSFSRGVLGQTGDGHFSPIAAYSEETDKCLVLDVARFKYPPYWVSVQDLYESTRPLDSMTNKSRGWFIIYPPSNQLDSKKSGFLGTKTFDEAMRPADIVPAADERTKDHLCPVGDIKVKYCSVRSSKTEKI